MRFEVEHLGYESLAGAPFRQTSDAGSGLGNKVQEMDHIQC